VRYISAKFPLVISTNGGEGAKKKPRLAERLTVVETLGDYVRFDEYDEEGTCNWWYWDRFELNELWEEVAIHKLMKSLIKEGKI